MRKKYLALSRAEEKYLKNLVSKGQSSARLFKRAMALLQLNQGKTLCAVAHALDVTHQRVARWRDDYLSSGLKLIKKKLRSALPTIISDKLRARITPHACPTTAEGHAPWKLR